MRDAAAGPGAEPSGVESPAAQWRQARVGVAAVLVAVLAVGWALWWGARAPARSLVPAWVWGPQAARGPLVAAVLADYRRVTAGDLPGHARDLDAVRAATGLPVEPLRAPGLRLLAAWTTTLGEETAAVLAYRTGDRLVLHYIVPESLYFRHAALRAAAAARQPLTAVDGAQAVVAWPEAAAGALLVSNGEGPSRLLFLLSAATRR